MVSDFPQVSLSLVHMLPAEAFVIKILTTLCLITLSWYLFAYSRFAYFRPKSGVSPILEKFYLGIKVIDVGVDFH